jgi:hypothetical protein
MADHIAGKFAVDLANRIYLNFDTMSTAQTSSTSSAKRHDPRLDPDFTMGQNGSLNILARENRGILFDLFIFAINLLLMPFITKAFVDIGRAAAGGQRALQFLLFLFFASIYFIQPYGALFKRWSFHQRRRAGRRRKKNTDGIIFTFADDGVWSLIFNPIVYFLALLLISSMIITYLNQLITGRFFSDDDPYFIVFILMGFLVSVVHSVAAYKYFLSPKKEPKKKILASSFSEPVGDILLFVNIFLFQILWNIVGQIPFEKSSDPGGLALRVLFMLGVGILMYYPARIFYSAEDIRNPLAWFTIVLANIPLVLRVFLFK